MGAAPENGEIMAQFLVAIHHMGGFWILEVADMDEPLAWGRKAAVAYRAPVEVRPFQPRVRQGGRSKEA
jgi:hypothetical protein